MEQIKTEVSQEKKIDSNSLDGILNRISDDFKDVQPIHDLARLLQINTGQLVLQIIIIAFFLTIIGSGSFIVNCTIGMLYPGYMTIKLIKSQDQSEIKQWLSYWILFLSTFLLDKLIWAIFHHFEAIYHPVKTMFLIWLYYPRTQGAKIIYDKFLSDILIKFDLLPNKQNNKQEEAKQ